MEGAAFIRVSAGIWGGLCGLAAPVALYITWLLWDVLTIEPCALAENQCVPSASTTIAGWVAAPLGLAVVLSLALASVSGIAHSATGGGRWLRRLRWGTLAALLASSVLALWLVAFHFDPDYSRSL